MANIKITIENGNITDIYLDELENEIEKSDTIDTEILDVVTDDSLTDEKNLAAYKLAKKELISYFQGSIRHFSFPFKYDGGNFDKKVWEKMIKIPYGSLISYGTIAKSLDSRAFQAVGNACAKNRLPVLIPCHRVVKSDGSLGNFAYGIKLKKYLIDLEHNNNKLNL